MEIKPTDSASKSSAWTSQRSAWEMTRDLWQSPLYIQEQGTKYLEKFRKEPDQKYEERRLRSVPRNKFRESIETMAGMVFKEDPAPMDAPEALKEMFSDIDACGNSLHSFLLTSFEKYLRDGGGAFWIDSTKLSPDNKKKVEDGGTLTAADRKNDRVFWVFIEASQIINHRYDKVNGVDVLVQATIEQTEIEPDGDFGEKEVKRHYIMRPGSCEVRVENTEKKNEFVLESTSQTGLDEIPLVPLAPFGTPPPLLDLAMLTVSYYNKLSDFDSWCHIACVPRQVIKLQSEEDATKYQQLNQSADVGLMIYGEHAEVSYLEVTGAGLEIAKERLSDLYAEMSSIGVGMLAPTEFAPRSATEVVDTAGQRQSKLARHAREFENGTEKAFYFTAQLKQGISGAGSINLNETEKTALKLKMDFDRLTYSPEQMEIMTKLFESGDLSHKTFFELIETSFTMPKDWTPEEELKRLKEDGPVINAGKMPQEPKPAVEVEVVQ
jgi:hypothetical protein